MIHIIMLSVKPTNGIVGHDRTEAMGKAHREQTKLVPGARIAQRVYTTLVYHSPLDEVLKIMIWRFHSPRPRQILNELRPSCVFHIRF